MRRLLLLLMVIGAAGVAFVLVPFGPPPPLTTGVTTIADKQATFARQLELGLLYEQSRRYPEAQKAYGEAALADQVEIAAAAQNGLRRVLPYQQDPGLRFQLWLHDRLFDTALPLLALVFLAWGGWTLFTWGGPQKGYMLLPFEDFTSDKLAGDLHALINYHVQEMRQTQQQGPTRLLGLATLEFPLVSTLAEPHDALADSLAALESVSVGGVQLPFGKFLAAMREWLGLRQYALSGTVHLQGKVVRLYAEVRETKTRRLVASWELAGENEDAGQQVNDLAYELASRFLYLVLAPCRTDGPQGAGAGSWKSLQLFTEVVKSLHYEVSPVRRAQLNHARDLLNQIVLVDPAYVAARYVLGIVYTRLGQYSDAREQFKEVTESGESLRIEATYNIGLTYYYEFAPWAYQKADEFFTQVVQASSDPITPTRKLCLALAHAGLASIAAQRIGEDDYAGQAKELLARLEKHRAEAEKLLEPRADNEQARLVRALLENAQGIAFYYASRFAEARKRLRQATHYYAENPVAYGYLALIRLEDGSPTLALQDLALTQTWEPAPQLMEYLYYKFGRYYHKQEAWPQAIEFYSKAPSLFKAATYLGEVCLQPEVAEYEDALAAFEQANRLDGKQPSLWRAVAEVIVTAYPRDAEQLKKAAAAAERAIQLDPKDWRGKNMLGRVLVCQGQWERAVKEFTASIELAGDEPENHFHLADTYAALKHWRAALDEIDRAFATHKPKSKWMPELAALKGNILRQMPPAAVEEPRA